MKSEILFSGTAPSGPWIQIPSPKCLPIIWESVNLQATSDLQMHFCYRLCNSSVAMCAMYHNTNNWQEFRGRVSEFGGGGGSKIENLFSITPVVYENGGATENFTSSWCHFTCQHCNIQQMMQRHISICNSDFWGMQIVSNKMNVLCWYYTCDTIIICNMVNWHTDVDIYCCYVCVKKKNILWTLLFPTCKSMEV